MGREETERNKFNAFRGYWWVVFLLFIFSSHILIYCSFHQPNRNHKIPRPYASSKNLHVVFST